MPPPAFRVCLARVRVRACARARARARVCGCVGVWVGVCARARVCVTHRHCVCSFATFFVSAFRAHVRVVVVVDRVCACEGGTRLVGRWLVGLVLTGSATTHTTHNWGRPPFYIP